MQKRKLGNSNLEVAPLMFGGNVFGWTIDEQMSHKLLDIFTDNGFNFIDTADVYSRWKPGNTGGDSEKIIGSWLKKTGKRDQVLIATKVGKDMGDGKKGLKPAYIKQAVEDSLKRLQTDYIDLYQSHDDDKKNPLAETMQAFDDLIKEGKVRAIGASNFTADRLMEALKVSAENGFARYESLQPEYNLYAREGYETELEQVCLQENLGVIPYYSLASGFLTGKYRSDADLSQSARGGGIKKYLNDRGFTILKALDEVAEQYNSNPAQISLAWLMHRPGITAPIASATSLVQLKDLTKAAHLELDKMAIDRLNKASAW